VLAWLYFVAAKVLLGFYEKHMLAQLRRILPKAELFGSIHSVLSGVINALTRLFTYESNQFALIAFFRHNLNSLTDVVYFVNGLTNCSLETKKLVDQTSSFAFSRAR
jgi:hypothetical protein